MDRAVKLLAVLWVAMLCYSQNPLPSPNANGGGGGGGGGCDPTQTVCIGTGHLTSGNILAFPDTGVVVMAGVTGKIIIPVWARFHYNFVTTDYTNLCAGLNPSEFFLWNGAWVYSTLQTPDSLGITAQGKSNAETFLPVVAGFGGSTQIWATAGAGGLTGAPLIICPYGHCVTAYAGTQPDQGCGGVRTYTLSGGTGYTAGQDLSVPTSPPFIIHIDTVNGGGTPLTSHMTAAGVQFTENGGIDGFTPDAGCKTLAIGGNAGLMYMAGDTINVATGDGSCAFTVATVNGMGAVTGLTQPTAGANQGNGYSVGSNQATTGGSGDGMLTVNVTVITGTGLGGTITGVTSFAGGDGTADVVFGYTEK